MLHDIARTYGAEVLNDPRRCRALLMDFCGEYRGEINLLDMALREGIPGELTAAGPIVPRGLLLARYSKMVTSCLMRQPGGPLRPARRR